MHYVMSSQTHTHTPHNPLPPPTHPPPRQPPHASARTTQRNIVPSCLFGQGSANTRDSARSCGLWWQPRPHARALPATFRLAFQAHQGHHWQPLCLRFFAIVLCHPGSPQKCPFFSQPFCDMRQLFLEPRHYTSTPSTSLSTAQFAWVVLATPSKAPIYPIKSPTLACDTRRAAPTYSQPDVRPTVVFLQTK